MNLYHKNFNEKTHKNQIITSKLEDEIFTITKNNNKLIEKNKELGKNISKLKNFIQTEISSCNN